MLAYNQFAVTPSTDTTLRSYVTPSPITFPTGMAGGMGRKGAQKVVIFETDGLANCHATASLVNAGTYNYYKIRYDMNNPNRKRISLVTATTINDTDGPEPGLYAGPATGDRLRHHAEPVPALRDRLWSGLPGGERQFGTDDLADHAVLRGHAERAHPPRAVEPDHHGDGRADVHEHDLRVHEHPRERRADRTDQ